MTAITYIAHYQSPISGDPQSGIFEFESEHKMNSKMNLQDARFRMLELFGKDALSWNIVKVEKRTAKSQVADCQPAFDFREPTHSRKVHAVKRGTL